MEQNTVDLLARLMAEENLTIRRTNDTTARFDVTGRILYLPNWASESTHVTNLLVGHETGHAVETTETINNVFQKVSSLHAGIINIIEDARIERIVKEKYPGIRKDFHDGYLELVDRKFFDIPAGADTSKMNLCDRINLFFKTGRSAFKISFTPEEQVFVDKIADCYSEQGVLEIAEELLAYMKAKQKEQNKPKPPKPPVPDAGNDDSVSTPSPKQEQNDEPDQDPDKSNQPDEPQNSDQNPDSENQQSGGGSQDDESEDTNGSDDEGDANGSSSDEEAAKDDSKDEVTAPAETFTPGGTDEETSDDAERSSNAATPDFSEPAFDEEKEKPKTNEAFERNVKNLKIADKKSITYLTKKVQGIEAYEEKIVPISRVMQICRRYFERKGETFNTAGVEAALISEGNTLVKQAKENSGFMKAQFEALAAANVRLNTRRSKTGTLDSRRLVNYKFTNDIFKRIEIKPEGTNHGILFIVDTSGSMTHSLRAVMRETVNMAQFCRSAKIKFRVLGFSSIDFNDRFRTLDPKPARDSNIPEPNYGIQNIENDVLDFSKSFMKDSCSFVELFNDRMSQAEFEWMAAAVTRKGHVKSVITGEQEGTSWNLWNVFSLSMTPLDWATMFMAGYIPLYKKKFAIDSMSFICLSDGGSQEYALDYNSSAIYLDQRMIIDNKEYQMPFMGNMYGNGITEFFIRVIRDQGVNTIGFFLASPDKKTFVRDFSTSLSSEKARRDIARSVYKRRNYGKFTLPYDLNEYCKEVHKNISKNDGVLSTSEHNGFHEFHFMFNDQMYDYEMNTSTMVVESKKDIKKYLTAATATTLKSKPLLTAIAKLVSRKAEKA